MEFLDNEHKQFYEQKIKEIGTTDVYRKALIYTLAICPVTREYFSDIFDIKEGLINRNSLQAPYQISTSMKVTRLAFNLWNSNCYDSDEDLENCNVSTHYTPSDIFCCSYASYFYEAIKIRYPEYTTGYNNTIADVIQLVRDKYSDIIGLNLFDGTLTLEYLYIVNGDKDCYQLMEVSEFEEKLKIEFLTQHITKIIDIKELEDIFEMLGKKSTFKLPAKEEIEAIKQKYVKGSKIKLIKMYDPFSPPPTNTIGIVEFVDDIGQIHCNWDNGSTLALVVGIDQFKVLSVPRTKEEIQKIKDKYKIGTKIKMNKLSNRPIARKGLLGNIENVDDFGNIIVRYKTLGTETLVEGVDDFELL